METIHSHCYKIYCKFLPPYSSVQPIYTSRREYLEINYALRAPHAPWSLFCHTVTSSGMEHTILSPSPTLAFISEFCLPLHGYVLLHLPTPKKAVPSGATQGSKPTRYFPSLHIPSPSFGKGYQALPSCF